MAKTIIITNGVGTADVINGDYSVSSEVTGYDNTTINPSSVSITENTNKYEFTIAADGTLTLHVTEDGTSSGTPVVGATFIRSDADGNEYGSPITTDASGNAVFSNVPYAESNAPLIYFKELSSDGNHEFDNTVQSLSMTLQTYTQEITNALGAVRTFTLTDANYEGLVINSGNIILN